jgi:hypothetical protein
MRSTVRFDDDLWARSSRRTWRHSSSFTALRDARAAPGAMQRAISQDCLIKALRDAGMSQIEFPR